MGVGAGLYMYDVVVKKFTFAISSPDEFLTCPWMSGTRLSTRRVPDIYNSSHYISGTGRLSFRKVRYCSLLRWQLAPFRGKRGTAMANTASCRHNFKLRYVKLRFTLIQVSIVHLILIVLPHCHFFGCVFICCCIKECSCKYKLHRSKAWQWQWVLLLFLQ